MPFIRGRYHVNPIMGEALEAAREAEAAMLALERGSRDGHDGANHANDQADGFASPHPGEHATDRAASAPIHRVEIEAAEQEGPPWPREGTHGRSVEPGISNPRGRTERGFIARVHRGPVASALGDSAGAASNLTSRPGLPSHQEGLPGRRQGEPGRSETHVFSNHRDLLNFLHDELANDAARR